MTSTENNHWSMEQEVVQTRTARIWLGADGIVRDVFVLADAELTEADLKTNMEAINERHPQQAAGYLE